MTRFLKIFSAALFALALCVPAAAPALAHGHGGFHGGGGFHHGGGFHNHFIFGFGCCGGFGPYYPAYYPYYGYPYPDYYAYPPPVPVPTPGTVYQYEAPAYQPPPAQTQGSNCRQFNGDATVDASGEPFHGTACLGSDGRWHITNP